MCIIDTPILNAVLYIKKVANVKNKYTPKNEIYMTC